MYIPNDSTYIFQIAGSPELLPCVYFQQSDNETCANLFTDSRFTVGFDIL